MNTNTADHQEKTYRQFWDLPQEIQEMIRKISKLPFVTNFIEGFRQKGASYIFTFKTSPYLYARISSIKALIPKNYNSLEIDCLFGENEITVTIKKI